MAKKTCLYRIIEPFITLDHDSKIWVIEIKQIHAVFSTTTTTMTIIYNKSIISQKI